MSFSKIKKHLPFIFALLIIIIILPSVDFYLGWDKNLIQNSYILFQGLIFQWVIVIILFLIIFYWEKKPIRSIGIKKISIKDIIWVVLVLFICFVGYFFSTIIIEKMGLTAQNNYYSDMLILPISIIIFSILTTSITEEIIFRGYLIERFNLLTNHLFLAAAISYFIFVLYHLPFWGVGGTIQVAIWAIPVTFLYVYTRNLTSCIIVHIITNATILIPLITQYL